MNQGLTNCLYVNKGDFTALASFTSEATLLTKTPVQQPVIPSLFFDGPAAEGKCLRLLARGISTTTSDPTGVFFVRLGTTAALDIAGAAVWKTPSITFSNGTNVPWELNLDIQCTTSGQGTGNTTLTGTGSVRSAGGFVSPYEYLINPGGAASATHTNTINSLLTYYVSLSASASGTTVSLTVKHLSLLSLN